MSGETCFGDHDYHASLVSSEPKREKVTGRKHSRRRAKNDWLFYFYLVLFFISAFALGYLWRQRLGSNGIGLAQSSWRDSSKAHEMLRQLSRSRGSSQVIAIVHRPARAYKDRDQSLDLKDCQEILACIRDTPSTKPIDVILHTPGGRLVAAEQIALALSRHPSRVTVFVPYYAFSGGTMITLAADTIVMHPNAVLGPVDPQLFSGLLSQDSSAVAASDLLRAVQQKPAVNVDDNTLILAEAARKVIQAEKDLVHTIMQQRNTYGPETISLILDKLVSGETYPHDFPIHAQQAAREFGLNVNTQLPKNVHEFADHVLGQSPSVDKTFYACQNKD